MPEMPTFRMYAKLSKYFNVSRNLGKAIERKDDIDGNDTMEPFLQAWQKHRYHHHYRDSMCRSMIQKHHSA